jgi:hypothetical protein
MAAKSTTAGTPVKSYRMTLAGLKGISRSYSELSFQLRIVSMSAFFTLNSSQFLRADSKSTLTEKGRVSTLASFNSLREKKE